MSDGKVSDLAGASRRNALPESRQSHVKQARRSLHYGGPEYGSSAKRHPVSSHPKRCPSHLQTVCTFIKKILAVSNGDFCYFLTGLSFSWRGTTGHRGSAGVYYRPVRDRLPTIPVCNFQHHIFSGKSESNPQSFPHSVGRWSKQMR